MSDITMILVNNYTVWKWYDCASGAPRENRTKRIGIRLLSMKTCIHCFLIILIMYLSNTPLKWSFIYIYIYIYIYNLRIQHLETLLLRLTLWYCSMCLSYVNNLLFQPSVLSWKYTLRSASATLHQLLLMTSNTPPTMTGIALGSIQQTSQTPLTTSLAKKGSHNSDFLDGDKANYFWNNNY